LAQFGTISRQAAIERTAKASRGGTSETLKPYMEAVRALFEDLEDSAGTLALSVDDKPSKERARLRAAYRKVIKAEGMALPSNGLVVKRSGDELVFYVDKNAEPREHKGGRRKKNAEPSVDPATLTANGAPKQIGNVAQAEQRTRQAVGAGAKNSKTDDVEL
jgi:hypothetical protein